MFLIMAGLWSTGCAESSSLHWAQTAPTIAPEPASAGVARSGDPATAVQLGVWSDVGE